MNTQEIMQRVSTRIKQDEDFATQLEKAIERGTWEIVADLISNVVGLLISRTSEGLESLKESLR
jgi:hypothetical protein